METCRNIFIQKNANNILDSTNEIMEPDRSDLIWNRNSASLQTGEIRMPMV
jgi:hypothetical protein